MAGDRGQHRGPGHPGQGLPPAQDELQEEHPDLSQLVDAIPEQMLQALGYYGPAVAAPAAFARLSIGLDEAIVRVITARPGLEPVIQATAALTPSLIRAA